MERHNDRPLTEQIDYAFEQIGRLEEREDELLDAFGRFKRQVGREFARLRREIAELQDRDSAVATKFTIGEHMPGLITVDTTDETATISFVDDKGDEATAPTGAVITFASDNEAVATVAADSANPLQADITPLSVGTANISATSSGTALEADGVTPIPDPDPVTVTVSAGAAAGEAFVLSV